MRRIKALILVELALALAAPLHAQQAANGRFFPPAGSANPPAYSANECTGYGTASGVTCTFGATPISGQFLLGDVPFNGTSAVLSSIGDGTGTCGLTGSDSFTIEPVYKNGTSYESYAFYTPAYAGTSGSLTFCWTGTASWAYPVAIALNNSLNASFDGYNKQQSTSAQTTRTTASNPIAVTGGNDLMIGMQTNSCGGSAPTAGVDGQGNTYTQQIDDSGVASIETLQETTENSFYATYTGAASCRWNMETFAVKAGLLNNSPAGWGANGKAFGNTIQGNGRYYIAQYAPADVLVDFGGGTNAATPTQTTLYAGTHGSAIASSSAYVLTNMGSSVVYDNSQQPLQLPYPAAISGVGYAGNGGLGLKGTTNSSGNGIGSVFATLTGVGASTAVGFTFYTDCSANDCGAVGGITGGTDYVNMHFGFTGVSGISPNLGTAQTGMLVAFENHGGGTINYYPAPMSAGPYRVNMQMNSSGHNYAMICDASGRALHTWTMTSGGGTPTGITMGVSGEEPTTAGYHYWWWNYVIHLNGAMNLNGPCF